MAKAKSKSSAAALAARMMMGTPAAKPAAKPALAKAKPAPAKAKPAPAKPVALPKPDAAKGKGKGIDDAIAAAKVGDEGVALAAALDAWVRTPSVLLADAIERLGARAAAAIQPPVGATPKERNAAWDAAARTGDPTIRHHLVAQLTDTKGNAETLARLQLLERHADPRVTNRILELIESPIYNASVSRTNTFWKYVFALLPALRDPRIAPRTKSWVAGWAANGSLNEPERVVLARRLAKLALPDIPDDTASAPAVRTLLAALDASAGALADDAARERDLLAAVYAAPEDDGPRLVYADWLEERGDPRGEFINLQLARGTGGKPTARETELLALHGQRLLGSLAPHVYKGSVRFARGFLVACRISDGRSENLALRPQPDPAWATLELVETTLPPLADVAMPVLRTALDIGQDDIVYLASLPAARVPPLVHLAIDNAYGDWQRTWDADAKAAAVAFGKLALPALRRLELRGSHPWTDDPGMSPKAMIWKWRRAGLGEFAVASTFQQLAAWHAVVAAEASIARFELRTGASENWADAFVATFTRDDVGALSRLEVTCPAGVGDGNAAYQTGDLARGLAALPTDALTRVAIQLPPKKLYADRPQLGELADAIARQTTLASPAAVTHRTR